MNLNPLNIWEIHWAVLRQGGLIVGLFVCRASQNEYDILTRRSALFINENAHVPKDNMPDKANFGAVT